MNLADMTRDERSLLLYIETCAVDQGGRVDPRKINDVDRKILKRWEKECLIAYGRIVAKDCSPSATHWVRLSGEAWLLAYEERRARAKRMWEDRNFTTTYEKRGEPTPDASHP